MAKGEKRYKPFWQQRKNQKTINKARAFVTLALAAVLALAGLLGGPEFWQPLREMFALDTDYTVTELPDENTAVHFIDVGQGDAVLIQCGGQFCLIDAGTPDCERSLLGYLEQAGVQKLDLLVMTHPHADHIGSMAAVLDRFGAERVLLPDFSLAPMPTTSTFEKVLDAIYRSGAAVDTAVKGNTYSIGSGTLTVLGSGIETENYNELSIATRFVDGSFTFMDTGDGEKGVEADLLEGGASLRADLYKAAHHGSNTSNTAKFLEAMSPRIVVVSCGKDNSYGHPHEEPMQRFAAVGASVYRTDELGSIVVTQENGAYRIFAGQSAETEGAA